MRFLVKGVLVFSLLSLPATAGALEQRSRASANVAHPVTHQAPQKKPIQSRPLTVSEGLSILGAALDSRHHPVSASDCSHHIHALYERAGFPYEYASSSDLYVGIDEFKRVASPQPGDLAVWRGHAGIVINPAQHTFFSVLSSGPGVDSYDSPYWKQKGRPRFFRYVKAVPKAALQASAASRKPPALSHAISHEQTAEDTVSKVSQRSSSPTVSTAKLTQTQPVSPETPGVLVVHFARPKPDDVATAFLQTFQDWEMNRNAPVQFQSDQSLIVFDHFEVKKVHIARNEGWADVQIDEPGSLTGNKALLHKRLEWQRWPLSRRDSKSWELSPAPNTIYLPRPIAVNVLAHELAQLTEDTEDTLDQSQQKAELARLLNVLLEQ